MLSKRPYNLYNLEKKRYFLYFSMYTNVINYSVYFVGVTRPDCNRWMLLKCFYFFTDFSKIINSKYIITLIEK